MGFASWLEWRGWRKSSPRPGRRRFTRRLYTYRTRPDAARGSADTQGTPTARAEALPADLLEWTNGQALIAKLAGQAGIRTGDRLSFTLAHERLQIFDAAGRNLRYRMEETGAIERGGSLVERSPV